MSITKETDAKQAGSALLRERGIAAAHRARSFESRAGGLLSLGMVCAIGLALLVWYYGTALRRPARAAESARARAASRAQAEMPLPPLPALAAFGETTPSRHRIETDTAANAAPRPGQSAAPGVRPLPWVPVAPSRSVPAARVRMASTVARRRRGALERRLSGPAFATQSGTDGASAARAPTAADAKPARVDLAPADPRSAGPIGAGIASAEPENPLGGGVPPVTSAVSGVDSYETIASDGNLSQFLKPALTPAVAARVLPTRTLLLPKGAFIDCTLETAIDSTLPGMTTCITATDTFGADGKVVLLERGSKLVGETRGAVQQGSSRVFVLWTEARTPTGVVIPLASPGTDELGRSGLRGTVNRHFLQRFGAALLISVIDAGAQAAQSRSGAIIYSPATSQDVMSEVLKDTLRIPPTVVKRQGDRIQVLVARDIDFRSVYELRTATSGR